MKIESREKSYHDIERVRACCIGDKIIVVSDYTKCKTEFIKYDTKKQDFY